MAERQRAQVGRCRPWRVHFDDRIEKRAERGAKMILRLGAYELDLCHVDAVQPEIFRVVWRLARRSDDHLYIARPQQRRAAEIDCQTALHGAGVAKAAIGDAVHLHFELNRGPPRRRQSAAERDAYALAALAPRRECRIPEE